LSGRCPGQESWGEWEENPRGVISIFVEEKRKKIRAMEEVAGEGRAGVGGKACTRENRKACKEGIAGGKVGLSQCGRQRVLKREGRLELAEREWGKLFAGVGGRKALRELRERTGRRGEKATKWERDTEGTIRVRKGVSVGIGGIGKEGVVERLRKKTKSFRREAKEVGRKKKKYGGGR